MLKVFFGLIQSMCSSHKTENLESCSFLKSVYGYMCDCLPENLSFLSHLLTRSPSREKAFLRERLLTDNLTAVQSLKRHLSEIFSVVFQMSLKGQKGSERMGPFASIYIKKVQCK